MLFSDERKHSLSIPAKDDKGNAVTVGWLVTHLCEVLMKDTRKEMFVLDGHVYVSLCLCFHRFSTLFNNQIIVLRYLSDLMHCISLVWVFSRSLTSAPRLQHPHRFQPCHKQYLPRTKQFAISKLSLTCNIAVQGSWFLSMTLIGNWKEKPPMPCSPMTTSCLCRHFTAADCFLSRFDISYDEHRSRSLVVLGYLFHDISLCHALPSSYLRARSDLAIKAPYDAVRAGWVCPAMGIWRS
jgi:hypothetical protein